MVAYHPADRVVIRQTGEALGRVAEDLKSTYDMMSPQDWRRRKVVFDNYAKHARLSRELLDLVKV